MAEPFTLWMTGLPGAGKSTLANILEETLLNEGVRIAVLDGDRVRREALYTLGFTRADRDTNIRVIGFVAKTLNEHGVSAVVAVISPYAETRIEVRKGIENFIEVHVDCPVEVCIERDPKGLYAKALSGEIEKMTGISDPYEAPESPELVIRTRDASPAACVDEIVAHLREEGLI